MKALSLIAALLFVSCAYAQSLQAIAHLTGGTANPNLRGTVTFDQLANGSVVITVSASGVVNPGVAHGIHIHEFGDISMLNGTSVGGHYNPDNEVHGCPETSGTDRHLGDTGNWDVDAGGIISQTKVIDLLTLTGGKSIIGHAVVLHNKTDDCLNVSSSGGRLGFGVIGISNLAYHNTSGNNTVSNGATAVPFASCVIQQINNSNVTGFVYFEQSAVGGPTTISAVVNGLDGKKHGFHIHEFGDLSDLIGGSSVGGHYNPLGSNHSLPGYKQGHIGDLGNIYHYSNSVAFYKFTNSYVSLAGTNNVIGRAIVVHSMEDKCTVASAGARLGFCVIGINGGFTTLSLPSSVPTAQDTLACDPSQATTGTTGDSSASSFSQVQMIAMALVAIIFVAMF